MIHRWRRRDSPGERAFAEWVRDEYGVDLTFDEDGLRHADSLADRAKYTSGERRQRLESGLTWFVAEWLRRRHGGVFKDDERALILPNGPDLNVGAWVAKRLHFGRADSLVAKAAVAGQLLNPTPEPDWDPSWPEDKKSADAFGADLNLRLEEREPIDEAIVEWLTLRKEVYLMPREVIAVGEVKPDLTDQAFLVLRSKLRAYAEAEEARAACYALARRHKAHAWVNHWRFGRSLSGPSSFIVDLDERIALRLTPHEFVAMLRYFAGTPQYRDNSLLDMIWRVQKASRFRARASAGQLHEASLHMLGMISEMSPWTATKHAKRLLEFVDRDDAEIVSAMEGVKSEHSPEYWDVLRRIIFCAADSPRSVGLAFGRDVLAWLDGSRGARPSAAWQLRRAELEEQDAVSLKRLTVWLVKEGDQIRRDKDTGEGRATDCAMGQGRSLVSGRDQVLTAVRFCLVRTHALPGSNSVN